MSLENYTQIKRDLKWAIEQIRCLSRCNPTTPTIEQNNIFRVIRGYYLPSYDESGDIIDKALFTINNTLSFTITDIENYLITLNPKAPSVREGETNTTDKFLVKNLGKNLPTEMYGYGGITLTRDNIEFIATSITIPQDIIDENTQFITIPDLGLLSIEQYLNSSNPPILIQNQNEGSVIFNVGTAPNILQYWFLSDGGLYGAFQLQSVEEDFILLSSEDTPILPTLKVYQNGQTPIENVNEIEIIGATVQEIILGKILISFINASPTVKGIAKLYLNLLASNTDGSVHQKAIVDEFLLYLKKPVERTGYVMAFDRLAIYNDFSIATSASVITNNLVNAQKGIVQKMTIKTSSLNPFPAGWVLLGFVRYTAGALTNVYCEWISGSRVEYWLEKPTS